jgi:tetratricopeptide (TPR) repeat protein
VSTDTVPKARALLDVGRADEAAALLSTALAADPGQWRAWCLLGAAHLKRRRYDEALKCGRGAIELEPSQEWPHRITSIAERHLGNLEQAVVAAREAVRLAPFEAFAHAELAVALSHTNPWRPLEALNAASRSLELRPHDATLQSMAGDVALRLHHKKLAKTRYQRALEIDPSNAVAVNNIALIRLGRGLPIAAARGFSHAAALDPTSDRHRRNVDVAVNHALASAAVLLGAVAVTDVVRPIAEPVALVIAITLIVAFLLSARRMIGPAAWAYAIRVPAHYERATLQAIMIAVQVCLLAPVGIINRHSPSQLIGWPLILGVWSLGSVIRHRLTT